ncbi:MAG: radical SAM protein [Candidatus Omnitrophica bacterium COP1]|nr:radical SAM protein [Candidatus Omnitrophica bacterium COP1]
MKRTSPKESTHRSKAPRKAHVISLGCPKNLVDTERFVAMLEEKGYQLTQSPEEAQVLLVNTCSFIDDAKRESIDAVLEMADLKTEDQKLVIAGCLVDRYRRELEVEFPEVDQWVDLKTFSQFAPSIDPSNRAVQRDGYLPLEVTVEKTVSPKIPWAGFRRHRLTPVHTAYLKISEGCDHSCSFCSIPSFKGPQRSVPLELLIDEARALVHEGAKELTLIGQDTVAYGKDELEWVYVNLPKCIPYLDLPLQHLSDPLLERMRRGTPYKAIRAHVNRLRDAVPELVLRSTCIVGFPGESPGDYRLLKERFAELQVDHLGVFRYSDEENTPAVKLDRKVGDRTAKKRYEEMSAWAAEYCQARARERLGKEFMVLVDHPAAAPQELFDGIQESSGWWVGRWWGQAPEIDGVVYIRSERLRAGDFAQVRFEQVSYPDYLGVKVSSRKPRGSEHSSLQKSRPN